MMQNGIMNAMNPQQQAALDRWDSHTFSKVLAIVSLNSKYARALTSENFFFVPRLITETDNAGEDDARFEDADDDDAS